MKIILSLAFCLTLISCTKKDWNCTCTVNGDEYKKSIPNTTQGRAGNECSEYGKAIGQSYYGNYTYKCIVK